MGGNHHLYFFNILLGNYLKEPSVVLLKFVVSLLTQYLKYTTPIPIAPDTEEIFTV